MPLQRFHPAVAAWFDGVFDAPTPAQAQAWPAIASGRHTLVAAPTGSGKTLTAFMAAIDALVREGLEHDGELEDATSVVYVSPLKALSNDIHANLEVPLAGIRAQLARMGLPDVDIRTAVRTGDTPQAERTAMRKRPPHILVTTPESLYVLLGSESGRAMLASTRSVIVDEIHAVAASKRGSHLSLTLERLEALCQRRLTRIGLSATQKPIETVARFLVGAGSDAALPGLAAEGNAGEDDAIDCAIVDVGYTRKRDLALEVPPLPLDAVMSNDAWELVYNRIANLVEAHRTTLVFVNTRRMAERAARQLSERLGTDAVAAHHGSLSKEHRLAAEQNLKHGRLRVLVATASLELGIDIGEVDLVCQLGSPRSIATVLQRVGRSGHSVGGTPKGRLFPATRDDLVECTALLDCIRKGELDALTIPPAPLDVLAQQLVAELASSEWDEDALFAMVRRAWAYAALSRADFDAIVRMLAEGFSTRRGPRAAYVHRDAVHGRVRGRRNARLTALTSGGTIPDTADYRVELEPQAQIIGSVNEDFAVESMAGDVFQLGNQSYRVLRVERDRLRVEDAQGQPPSIPFWIGEAPGRSDELSAGVARLRADIAARLDADGTEAALAWAMDALELTEGAARQLVDYLAAAKAALGVLPTLDTLVMERFFDESGGMQLIIHSPYGSRINRAWGLALRKRFCRSFNFELQAAATEDAIVLSLSTSHSFPLDEVARYLHTNTAEHVLTQALLDAPLFPVRWRWNAVTALALPRMSGGRKTPPQIQRMRSEDLLATVFPDQVACLENIVGERQIPDHPLVAQTLHDCLHEAMDIDGLLRVLDGLQSGAITMVARDLPAPSPLAAGILNAAPYAFLDDAPLEERRTQAVQTRRWTDPDNTDDLAALDPGAIDAVRGEAWPEPRDADEMHEALMGLGCVTAQDAEAHDGWTQWLDKLARDRRATRLMLSDSGSIVIEHSSKNPFPRSRGKVAEGRKGATEPQELASPKASESESFESPASNLPSATSPQIPSPARGGRWPQAGWGPTEPQELAPPKTSESKDEQPTGFNLSSATSPHAGPHLPSASSPAGGGRGVAMDFLWIAAERLPAWRALHPEAPMQPAIEAPREYAAQEWSVDDARVELLRARLTGLGPTRVDELAATFALPASDITAALTALQTEGYVMQGAFTPGAAADEWCERHLLARIHRYTIGRLRREIAPVKRRDYMRFLFDWQRVAPAARVSGPEALAGVLAQLEGFEAAAGAWESELLPARVSDYSIAWLDDLCRAGRLVWTRLRSAGGDAQTSHAAGPVRSSPIVLLPRRTLSTWTALAGRDACEPTLSSRAQAVVETLAARGASFFDELSADTRLLDSELEDALGELVAVGAINADSFAGLRALLTPASKRHSRRHRRVRHNTLSGIQDAGRWALTHKKPVATPLPPMENPRQNPFLRSRGKVAEGRKGAGSGSPRHSAGRRPEPAQQMDVTEACAQSLGHEGSGDATYGSSAGPHPGPPPQAGEGKSVGIDSPLRVGAEMSGMGSRGKSPAKADQNAIEHVARTLLRRYGVVSWRLLQREAAWLPPWRALLRVYHRLEARGEIRGGRFIDGLVGEQFALPEAVDLLRAVRKRPADGQLVCISGADPLNLVGTVLTGSKVPAVTGSRVLYRDGIAIAALIAGKCTPLQELDSADLEGARHALLRDSAAPDVLPQPAPDVRGTL